jgi:hypothetical protein
MSEQIVCTPKMLSRDKWMLAATNAVRINPMNLPAFGRLAMAQPDLKLSKEAIAVIITRYWKTDGVHLTVGFLDNPPSDLRARILSHMNAWNKTANVQFVETSTDPQVRISRATGMKDGGYWSWLGTEILEIDADQPTMNLEGFTMNTPDSEFYRVVRHETGHTLGCPHEHLRKEIVDRIDPQKAIEYFQAVDGWNPQMTRDQVLTPLEDSSLLKTPNPDPNSIMCYQLPGSVMKDHQSVLGGTDIDDSDYAFMSGIYTKH